MTTEKKHLSLALRLVLHVILLGIFVQCTSSDTDCPHRFGDDIEIQDLPSFCLPDGSQVTIDAIENSICPCNALCVWEGEITVSLSRDFGDGSRDTFTVHSVLKEQNPAWAKIKEFDGASCAPNIEKIYLIISS